MIASSESQNFIEAYMPFLDEILEQPAAIRRTISALQHVDSDLGQVAQMLRAGAINRIIFTGMGGSYAARDPILIRLNEAGLPAFGINTAELLHYRFNVLDKRTLLLMVSQSGESVEAVRVAEQWKNRGMLVAITNSGSNTVSAMADVSLAFHAGAEETVSTKTFTCTLAALTLIAGALVDDDLGKLNTDLEIVVSAIEDYLKNWGSNGRALLDAHQPQEMLMLLARGPSMASALNGALVLKESTHVLAEGMNVGEFRHGPIEEAGPQWPTLMFMSQGRTCDLIARMAVDLLALGSRFAVVGPTNPDPRAFHVQLLALSEYVSPIAEIVVVHTLAYHLAKHRGLEPGKFARIGKVTRSE